MAGVPVISVDFLEKLYEKEIDAVIIATRGNYSRLCIIQQLKRTKIKRVGIFKFSAHDFRKKIQFDEFADSKYIVWLYKLEKPVLPYLEVNVEDACNLKCKGCTHFSNLFEELSSADLQQFKQDIMQIRKKSYVIQLRLLGGEPLLNKELHKFVEISRKSLPNADISIVTNGLLIPKQKPELFEIMRDNNVGFLITKYKPTMHMKDKIENILQKNKVDYFFERDMVYEFTKTLSMKGDSNTEVSQKMCISLGCRFLRNGRLYKCPFEGLIDKFALAYGYETVLKEERGFDIYDNIIDWEKKLEQYWSSAIPICKYCAEKSENFKWEVKKNPQKEDWLV